MGNMAFNTLVHLMVALLIAVPASQSTGDAAGSSFDADAFFGYLKRVPEPDLLIYNRVPKTGSSTLDNIFNLGSAQCPLQLQALHLNKTYWGQFEYHQRDLDAVVTKWVNMRRTAHRVITGHFKYPTTRRQ